jgi:NAD(P)H-hydrate epimerase
MENAAIRIFDEVKKILVELPEKRAVVFAGKGNNGGDAFAVARHLHNNDVITEIYVTCSKSEITGDAGINLKVVENMGIVPIELNENIISELSE